MSPLPAGGMFLTVVAFRRVPVKVCRNSLAGLVMLPGLEFRAVAAAARHTAGKQTMLRLGQTADSPCPAHAGTLELVWGIVKNCKKLGGDRRHALALPATVR